MNWLRLVYGTAIIATLTGTAIYYDGTRAVVKPIDIVELHEAAYERLMPFGYTLATNTLIYEQPRWTVDGSASRWQLGTNQMPYLVFDGVDTITDQFINVSGIAHQGTWQTWANGDDEGGGWFFWGSGQSVPGPEDFEPFKDQWTISCVQTGLTFSYDYFTGETNETPAYVLDVHPRGVGVYNNKSSLDWIDNTISNVIPRYADHEAAVNGVFTSSVIPMLTVSSVWCRLDLPYIWTNISRTATNIISTWTDAGVARSGTNAAWVCSTNITTNFTFTTGPICTTNMLYERFRVLQYLQWTVAPKNINHYPYSDPFAWSNSVALTWVLQTNVWNSLHDSAILHVEGYVPPYGAPPSFPSWWDPSLTNGPPQDWFTPERSVTIVDSAIGVSTTNSVSYYGRPMKKYWSAGVYEKRQFCEVNPFYELGPDYYKCDFNDWLRIDYTNTFFKQNSRPAVPVPYNIGGISVTGDVYVVLRVQDSQHSWPIDVLTNLITADMTSTGASVWVGEEMDLSDGLLIETNYPLTFGLSFPGVYDPWMYNVTWGCSWETAGGAFAPSFEEIYPQNVVFKWNFSKCAP